MQEFFPQWINNANIFLAIGCFRNYFSKSSELIYLLSGVVPLLAAQYSTEVSASRQL